MVIKSKVYELLKKYIGEYLYGFEKDQLDIALLSGNIYLRNVNFKPSKVNELLASYRLPMHLKAGLIGELRFKCHYTSMLSSPIELFIDELFLVFGPVCIDPETLVSGRTETFLSSADSSSNSLNNSVTEESSAINEADDIGSDEGKATLPVGRVLEASKSLCGTSEDRVKRACLIEMDHSDLTPAESMEYTEELKLEPHQPSFLEKYFVKVAKNLKFHVHKVHVRYEDDVYPYQNPFAAGFCVENIEISTAKSEFFLNETGEVQTRIPPKDATAKSAKLSDFGVYVSSMAGMLIPLSLCESTKDSPIGIFSAFPASDVRTLILEEAELIRAPHSALISPLGVSINLTLFSESTELHVCALCDAVNVNVTSAMADCYRSFCEYYENIHMWGCARSHRPHERMPLIPKEQDEPAEVTHNRFRIAQKWLRYAYKFVREKRRIIKFIQFRREEIQREREIMQRHQMNEAMKNAKKQGNSQNSVGNAPKKLAIENSRTLLQRPGSISSLFSSGSTRNLGVSKMSLNAVVKCFSQGKQQGPLPISRPPSKRQYKGEIYFPKLIENSRIQGRAGSIKLTFYDEDTRVRCTIENHYVFANARVAFDELSLAFGL